MHGILAAAVDRLKLSSDGSAALALADKACVLLQESCVVASMPTHHASGRPLRDDCRAEVRAKVEAVASYAGTTHRVKEMFGDLRSEEVHLLLRTLHENMCVRTLHLQDCGLKPEHLEPLLQLLIARRQIWAVNLGEMSENPSRAALRAFIQVLRRTSVSFAYMSEPVFASCRREKKNMIDALRENREALREIELMFYNPSEKYKKSWGYERVLARLEERGHLERGMCGA
jgi:hypothetical protein